LVRRSDDINFLPGALELPGRHIEPGEDIVDGLKRELLEELGVDSRVGEPFFVFTYNRRDKETQTIEVIYFATIQGDSQLQLSHEHSEYLWVSESDLDTIRVGKDHADPELSAIHQAFTHLSSLSKKSIDSNQ
jgi:8-oxo-dGTP pyrophosphatase MutT (NUDIX family)